MPTINVNVPDKLLAEEAQREIKSLKRKNLTLQTKNEKLQRELINNKETIRRAKNIVEAVRDAGEFDHYDS